MLTSNQLLIIIGMSLVTYLPRAVPLVLFANSDVSPAVKQWLQYIPSAVFAALVFSDVFFWESSLSLSLLTNKKILSSVFVLFVALKTKSLTWSILAGVGSLAFLLYVL